MPGEVAKTRILPEVAAAIGDDQLSIEDYSKNLREFNEDFCRNMFNRRDFTLKFEIHGNGGKIIHCRVSNDRFARPTQGGGGKKK